MITNWKVFNFKSIRSETDITLAPLTIFAGANSSGKSTLIQSILLVAQTLAHKVSSRSVVLNGAYTRLGQFDDLKSTGSEANQISIGWTCCQIGDPTGAASDWSSYRRWHHIPGRAGTPIREITCEIAFDIGSMDATREVLQIQPKLYSCQLGILLQGRDGGDSRYKMTIHRSPVEANTDEQKKKWDYTKSADESVIISSMAYDVELDADSLSDIRDEYVSAQPIGCILRHFLPDLLALGLDMARENARRITAILAEPPRPASRRYYAERNIVIPDSVCSAILESIGGAGEAILKPPGQQPGLFPEDEQRSLTLYDILERQRELPYSQRTELRRSISDPSELEAKIAEAYAAEGDPKLETTLLRPPTALNEATRYLDDFFSASVRYLGPLRDEPKAMYPLAPAADPLDVGLRGEHTAAVLDLHRNRSVRYIPSSDFREPHVKPRVISRSLEAAVVDWLQYLGVAEAVRTVDRGKYGHEMKVSVSSKGQLHDLTHVGVGVSQVLPILVTCLLADPDTTLIFEQPELHLHPKVQTLLADFFLSMTVLGKQCIVETHSEYLVNRLRFRTAAASDDHRWLSAMKMYFVERTDDTSAFREVKINEYGAILDWPEGFFDQTQSESESILRAAAQKRKRQREQPQ